MPTHQSVISMPGGMPTSLRGSQRTLLSRSPFHASTSRNGASGVPVIGASDRLRTAAVTRNA